MMIDYSLLDKIPAKITFRKVNGEVRTMYATRNAAYIPEKFAPKTNVAEDVGTLEEEAPTVVHVFDLDKNAWRSFKPELLLSLEPATFIKEPKYD